MRERRLVFGEDAELYDRVRPSYPRTLIDTLVSSVGSPARVLDVGCGTGKAAVLLAERGLSGIGVEPDSQMATVAERRLGGYPDWKVTVADFEDWEPSPSEVPFDLVTCAQAWHWLDPEVRLVKAHTLLRSDGTLALWWNRPAEEDSPLRLVMDRLYGPLAPELPARGVGSQGPPDVGEVPPGLSFSQPACRTFPWTQEYTSDQWVDLLRTQSDHRLLPPDRLDALTSAIHRAIEDHGGTYTHSYVCWLWTLQRA
jgi:SAM-dependent methyltransferase